MCIINTCSTLNELFINCYSFLVLKDFEEWKDKVEEESCSYFIKRRRVRKMMVTRQYYDCNRSGVFKKRRGDGIKRMKSQGTCKIGKKCQAKIIVHQNMTDGSVSVKYHSEHNHETVLQHLRIQKPLRDSIAGE